MALSCAADLLGCGKLFVRWLHGTCLPTPPPKAGDDRSIFTFYRELSSNAEVSALMYQIVQTLKVTYIYADQRASSWDFRPHNVAYARHLIRECLSVECPSVCLSHF